MDALRRLLREPLVHFLAAGVVIFAAYAWRGNAVDPPRRIVVNRGALMQYLQYQSRAFAPGSSAQQLESLSPTQLRQLVDDYVREEVLYREATALGLERGDSVMRQRLVQKMSFLLEGAQDIHPGDSDLQQYLQANRKLYTVEPAWTFTHVFIDPAARGEVAAAARARTLLSEMNARHAQFNDAPRYSDRFPFLQNYVERTPAYIASQFGEAFVLELASAEVRPGVWQGPLHSELGWHLVMVTAHSPERIPQLDEIRPQVLDDFRREHAAVAQERATRELIDRYEVRIGIGK